MNTTEIVKQFEELVQDSHNDTHLFQLMNQADAELRNLRDFESLKKIDNSQSAQIGDGYTSMKSLPSDFYRPIKRASLRVNGKKMIPCRFEDRELWKSDSGRYYIDHRNRQFALCGSGNQGTITIPYIYRPKKLVRTVSDSSTETDTPEWMDDDFHGIYAYKMAEIFQRGIDADDNAFRMSAEQIKQYTLLLNALLQYDTSLKLAASDYSAGFDTESTTPIDVSDL